MSSLAVHHVGMDASVKFGDSMSSHSGVIIAAAHFVMDGRSTSAVELMAMGAKHDSGFFFFYVLC